MKRFTKRTIRRSMKSSLRRVRLLFICIVTLLIISACSNSSPQPNHMQQSTADWEIHTFNELVQEESDLILIATVIAADQKDEEARRGVVQEATLAVEQVLRGHVTAKEIILYQSVDQVNIGQSYLLFLQHRPNIDKYVVVDPISQIHIGDIAAFMDNISALELKFGDVKGEYTLEEIRELVKK